jgi:hypothetical protein
MKIYILMYDNNNINIYNKILRQYIKKLQKKIKTSLENENDISKINLCSM